MSTGAIYRTNPEQVAALVEVDPEEEDLTPFIEVANELVTECCTFTPTVVYPGNCHHHGYIDPLYVPYTDIRLELIERWLAAHFYTVYDPRVESEGMGHGHAKMEGKTGMVLQSSKYGQHACLLDTKGRLAQLSRQTENGVKAKILSIGKKYIRGPYYNNSGYYDF